MVSVSDVSQILLSNWQVVVVGTLVLFLIVFVLFRRYLGGLISDIVFDGAFSFLDNLLLGAGALGLDIGDWIGAVIIFFKERKITNLWAAAFVAWEATNFIPFSFIPVIGEGLEVVTNFVPSVTIARIFFSMYGAAEAKKKELDDDIELSKQIGIKVGSAQKAQKKINEYLSREDPVDAYAVASKADKKLHGDIVSFVESMIEETQNEIMSLRSQSFDVSEEAISVLEDTVNQVEQMLGAAHEDEEEDIRQSVELVIDAHDTLADGIDDFNEALRAVM